MNFDESFGLLFLALVVVFLPWLSPHLRADNAGCLGSGQVPLLLSDSGVVSSEAGLTNKLFPAVDTLTDGTNLFLGSFENNFELGTS